MSAEYTAHFRDFLALCKDILGYVEKHSKINRYDKNAFLLAKDGIVRYIGLWSNDRNKPEHHQRYILKVYNENRSEILKGPSNDGWLLGKKEVFFYFGQEIPVPNGQKEVISPTAIYLSFIYRLTLLIANYLQEQVSGEDENELCYPEQFLAACYDLFIDCLNKKSQAEDIRLLREGLNTIVQIEEIPDPKSALDNFNPEVLNKLIGIVAKPVIGAMNLDEETTEEIKTQVNTLLSNTELSNIIKESVQGMEEKAQSGATPDELLQSMMKDVNLEDPSPEGSNNGSPEGSQGNAQEIQSNA